MSPFDVAVAKSCSNDCTYWWTIRERSKLTGKVALSGNFLVCSLFWDFERVVLWTAAYAHVLINTGSLYEDKAAPLQADLALSHSVLHSVPSSLLDTSVLI